MSDDKVFHVIVYDAGFRTAYIIPVDRMRDWNNYLEASLKACLDPPFRYLSLPDYATRIPESAHVHFTEWKFV